LEITPVMPPHAPDPLASLLGDGRAALLVIDVQVDFVAPHGFCAQRGADVSLVPALLDAIRRASVAARRAGQPVVFVRLETSSQTDSPAMLGHVARRGTPDGAALCRAGTLGADYWGIGPVPGDIEIVKSRYDAFLETSLDARLRQRGIETVVVTGVSTDCCVDSTARAAFMRDYNVVVLADACAAGSAQDHAAALSALGRHAATIARTADFVAALDQIATAA
jgi:nicotinamidase-related amidase